MSSTIPKIDVEVRHLHYRTDFLVVLKEIRPEWDAEDVTFQKTTKGLSQGRVNTMVRCYKTGCPHDSIMIRIHNESMAALLNHATEADIIQHFHALDCAPKLLAIFKTGFCYEFIQGEILSCDRLGEDPIWRRIAEEQAKMHCGTLERPPSLVPGGAHFLEQAKQMVLAYPEQLNDPSQNERFKADLPDKETLAKEFDESMAHALSFDPDLVLGHNDPRAENIIWNQETGQAKFVDFEAVFYIYRALTLCLHFNRFGGSEPTDYSRLPDEVMQTKWLRVYLEKYYSLTGRQSSDVTDREVRRLYVQVNKFKPIVFILSGVGMLVCDQMNAVDNRELDALGICIDAMKQYYKEKDQIRAMQMPD